MNHQIISSLRSAALLASVALGLVAAPSRGADKAPSDAFPLFESYIKITGQAPAVSGHDSSFARRLQMPDNGTYGIEALHFTKDGKDSNLTFDGKALTGSEDYLGAFKYTKNEVGSFEVGYKRFRVFYDGIGGFFPNNNRWAELANPELHTDRAKFWFGAKIERPNAPVFELRYTNEQRTGRKDSTIWGDTDFTGIPSYYGVGASALNPPYSVARKIIPSYINLNERQQNWIGTMKHTVGNTEIELEVTHNTTKSGDRRVMDRYPGELQLFPRQSSATNPPQQYPPETIANRVTGYDQQNIDSNTTGATGKFETKISESLAVYGGLLYSKGSADIGGDRQMTQYMPTAVGLVTAIGGFVGASGRPPYSYTTTAGETNEKVLAANFGVRFQPKADLLTTVALKYEKTDVDGFNSVTYVSNSINQTTGAVTPVTGAAPNVANRTEKSWIPEATFRYTGIKGVSFYGSVDYRHSPGTEYGSSAGAGTGGIIGAPVVSDDNVKLNHGHYKVGVNWTASTALTLRGELFYKDHTNGFYDRLTAGDGYVLGYQFMGEKLTAILKARSDLSFTTRFIHQTGKMDTTVDSGTTMRSNDTKVYNFGETVDWNPSASVYVQGNLNVVFNTIQTSYPVAGGLGNDVMRNADNDYISASFITGFVVDKETDATLQYTYYKADNYKAPSPATVFFGAGVKEYTITAGLKHKFSDRLVGNAKLGYISSRNMTTGGNTNFKGPIAYLSLDYAL